MRVITICIAILITSSCVAIKKPAISDTKFTRSAEYQKEINIILARDADNKKWERIYLTEIAIAQKNDDMESYKFFVKEYIMIPRLRLPEWLKSEPQYIPSISTEELEK